MLKHVVLIVGVIALTGFLVPRLQYTQDHMPGPGNKQNEAHAPLPTTTPPPSEPFLDLTIPYLRTHAYVSSLGPVQEIATNITYTTSLTSYTSDGLRIQGLLTVPVGTPPAGGWPAIVFVHGYIPPEQYKTREKYVAYVQTLASNKFVVFKIDLRGHGNSEGEPSGAYYSSDYVIDTLNAYAALQHAPFVNPSRIGLWGHSMAGNVVFRALAAKPDIPAAVIWAGAVYSYQDFQEYGIRDQSYQRPNESAPRVKRRQALFDLHGQFNAEDPFWKQVAATNYMHDIKGAIQLHHAQNDAVVDIRYSRNLNSLLEKTTIPHELFEYTQGGHNIDGTSFTTAMRRTVDFFTKWLQ